MKNLIKPFADNLSVSFIWALATWIVVVFLIKIKRKWNFKNSLKPLHFYVFFLSKIFEKLNHYDDEQR